MLYVQWDNFAFNIGKRNKILLCIYKYNYKKHLHHYMFSKTDGSINLSIDHDQLDLIHWIILFIRNFK